MGFYCHRVGGTFQRNWTPSIQEHQCFESWNSEKKRWQSYHTHQCGFIEQNSCFAHFTQQIRSISTEQLQGGVKSSLIGLRIKKEPTSERFAAKENEQVLKNVKPQEVNSLVQTPGCDNRASKNRMQECLQKFEILEKDIQFTKVCEDATFARRVSIGMSYKTFPDVNDGFGDRTPACREYTLPREDQNSGIYATIAGQTFIGPVLQAHIFRNLGMSGIDIQIRSTTTKDLASWVVICRGMNRYVEELPQFLNCYWKNLLQKKENLVRQRWSHQRAFLKLMLSSWKNLLNPVNK